MKSPMMLPAPVLKDLTDTALFYPGAGNDTALPIELFSPYVTDFWFVDRGYFRPGNVETRDYGWDRPADEVAPLLAGSRLYALLGTALEGPPCWSGSLRDLEPCVLTETYRHLATGREIRVHRRRGFGVSAFRKEVTSLGVFFYRGDSHGEGGSGNFWLRAERIDDVCRKLVDGGLIVTDGSQHGSGRQYSPLWEHHGRSESEVGPELVSTARAFSDVAGRTFSCVGYAGHRYGPTFAWRVRHPAAATGDGRTPAIRDRSDFATSDPKEVK